MVDVLPAEVDELVDDVCVGLPWGSTLLNIAVEPAGIIGLSMRIALGSSQGTSGMIGRRATMVSSSGLISDGVLPAQLARLRWDDDVVPGDPVHQLHVVQVEVDRVRIDAVVRDAPDLRPIASRSEMGVILTSLTGRPLAS